MSEMDMKRMRDRSPRDDRKRDRRSGRGDGGGSGKPLRRAPPERRVFISNFPFEMKWQEIKDMFRKEVGDVTYVELFNDEQDRPRGCGIMEFATPDLAKKCIEKMHRFEYKGRKLVVKEDFDTLRDKCGRIVGSRAARDRSRDRSHERDRSRGGDIRPVSNEFGNTFGLSPQFLDSLGINGPLHTRVFVANLSYEVDEKKLKEVFRLAGKIVMIELNRDKTGKSRGFAVLEYSHPVESVQAISMFNNQVLFERRMTVRFDNQTPYEDMDELPARLPEGLEGVGMGLGSNGDPLTDVSRNLPNIVENMQTTASNMGGTGGTGLNNGMDMALAVSNMATLARTMGLNLGNLGMGGSSAGPAPTGGSVPMSNGGSSGSMGMGSGGMNQNNMNPGMGMGGSSSMGMSGGSSGGINSGISMGGYSTGPTSSSNYPPSSAGVQSGGNMPDVSSAMGRQGVQQPQSRGGSDSIIIRNLPVDCNWQSLRDGFAHCGEIKYAEMKERTTGLIRFTSERDADRAVSMMDKQVIGNRTIDVRLY
ncbi:myelin expression factor 2 isoform X1 [Lepeophtheirus salmonis]|uniref:myelin expression factor 2 isoform X1 n=2 Tax=Lepeophtheirus salmonis TaxID=72036 RepID=UPI001AE7E893|nr:myelin expression factor 2-like [Lepeophtheirus salmonis]